MRYIKDVHRIFILILLLCTAVSGFSQNEVREKRVKRSKVYKIIGEKRFVLHVVEAGQTLYSISKAYETPINEIILVNPFLIDGLRVQDTLKIPGKKALKRITRNKHVEYKDTLIIHVVEKGQTVYSISKDYNVDLTDIYKINPESKKRIKVGQELKIPISVIVNNKYLSLPEFTRPKFISDELSLDSLRQDSAYNIALLLPFYLGENDLIKRFEKVSKKEIIFHRSRVALDFYEGVLLAVDSLNQLGMNARMFVYDTNSDADDIEEILEEPELKLMDLIIGFSPEHMLQITEFGKENNIHVVSPISSQNRVLLGKPNVSKVISSSTVHLRKIAQHVARRYEGSNIVIFHNRHIRELDRSTTFLEDLKKTRAAYRDTLGLESLNAKPDSIYVVPVDVFARNKHLIIKLALNDSVKNVIIIPSEDQPFVTVIMTELFKNSDKYDIKVFGMHKWKNYDNIDIDYYHKLDLHIPYPTSNKRDTALVGNYKNSFRMKYQTTPSKYATLGFDVAYYYFKLLFTYGAGFIEQIENVKHQGILNAFDFYKTGFNSGYENQSVSILRYADYKLIRVE